MYRDKLQKEYPKLGDQLDAIYKTFKELKLNGVVLGSAGDSWLEALDSIKDRDPRETS